MSVNIPLVKEVSIDYLLSVATPRIDVLGIVTGGVTYAKMLLPRLRERGVMYAIDPHEEVLQHPGTNPSNTLLLCDDAIQRGDTFRAISDFLVSVGYNFESDKPPHFAAIACTWDYQTRLDELGLVRDYFIIARP